GGRVAGLRAVTDVVVAAEDGRADDAAGRRAAGLDAVAGVRVAAHERRARRADSRLTGLRAVAEVAVEARRAVRGGRILAAEGRIAGVHGAGIAVDAVGRRTGIAHSARTGLGPVAHVAVRAGRAVGERRSWVAGARIAGVTRRTEVAVVARRA